MESDYHLVSHLSARPLPLPPPLFCFLLLSHSAREVKCHSVSVVKAANHPHSECKATVAKETVIRLLGTWSCAHNSHFVAWKHTQTHTHSYTNAHKNHINSFAQSTSSYKLQSHTVLINKRFAYAVVRNHRIVNDKGVIYHGHVCKQMLTHC